MRDKQQCEWRLQCHWAAIDLRRTQLSSESDNVTDEQQAAAARYFVMSDIFILLSVP